VDRPTIGIPTQTQAAIPGQAPPAWIMGQAYVNVVAVEGAVPWLIPLLRDQETLRLIYDRVDGLFLAGGFDVDPSRYGEERLPVCGQSDAMRDEVEITLLHWAMADRKPVLGVCRGSQIINVAAGGTLYQDLSAQLPGVSKHDCSPKAGVYERCSLIHEIELRAGSRLGKLLGVERAQVNSMHHQGFKSLGGGLAVAAMAPDGVIEAVESTTDQFLFGALWHPEELAATQPAMRRLITAFIDASREHLLRQPARLHCERA
jgi:putative glutamine amidotransferase